MKSLPIYECFYAWQGEGVHIGKAAYFIRTFCCPVKCPWCDSAGTWHPEYVPDKIDKYVPFELAEMARNYPCEFVIITGGEPAIHELNPLTTALREVGLGSHLETSGGFEIKGEFSWVTVSPKWWKMPINENIEKADEIKLIVEDESTIDRWMEKIGDYIHNKPVWLNPEWSQRSNRKVLKSISDKIKKSGNPFRAGYQFHKLYNVDLMDPNSKPPLPLGGKIENGF